VPQAGRVAGPVCRAGHESLARRPDALLRATYLTLDEHRAALSTAGFVDIEIHEQWARGWMAAIGRKPI
jgi:hypothetical protein